MGLKVKVHVSPSALTSVSASFHSPLYQSPAWYHPDPPAPMSLSRGARYSGHWLLQYWILALEGSGIWDLSRNLTATSNTSRASSQTTPMPLPSFQLRVSPNGATSTASPIFGSMG